MAYYEYQPTIDHIVPIALGGADNPGNWVTTSMLNNSAKANFTMDQLDWTIKERGDINDWDGMSALFVSMVESDQELLKIAGIRGWYEATVKAIQGLKDKMTREEIIDVMSESQNKKIHWVETDGNEWTGIVDVFETAYDNEGDEHEGASICVKRDDGHGVLVFEDDILAIEIIE